MLPLSGSDPISDNPLDNILIGYAKFFNFSFNIKSSSDNLFAAGFTGLGGSVEDIREFDPPGKVDLCVDFDVKLLCLTRATGPGLSSCVGGL
jgi:hypothetical protein